MKKFLLSLLLSVVTFSLWADDEVFSVVNNEKTIWFKVRYGTECMVTAPPEGYSYSGDYEIPETVTLGDIIYTVGTIGYQAFKESGITSVKIPRSLWTIENEAFKDAKSLIRITTSNNSKNVVGWLGVSAFSGCENLEGTIDFLNSKEVKWIRESTFYNCKKLEGIVLDEGLTNIDHHAFANCEKLNNVTIPNTVSVIENSAFENCRALSSINIPSGVTVIRPFCFKDCVTLSSIEIHDGVTEIGYNTFENSGLTTLNIPSSVKKIGDTAFGGCTNLGSVTLNEGLQKIEGGAFRGCVNLTDIDIPQSATNLGTEIFNGCSSLNSVKLPDDLNNIPWGTFKNCSALAYIKIPEAVKQVNGYAFENSGLTSIVLPEATNLIADFAFSGCEQLTSVNIPASVNNINEGAFKDCTNLDKIICEGVTPPANCNTNAFESVPSSCNLYATETYKTVAPWNNFAWKTNAGLVATIDLGVQEIKLLCNNDTKESLSLSATVTTRATNDHLTWTSSDENVATVSDGVVTAVGLGTTEIFATATDGSDKYGKVKVIVAEDKTYDFKTDGIYYRICANNNLDVAPRDHNYSTYSGTINIPANVTFGGKEYTVTRIGQYAFAYITTPLTVTLPNTVSAIDVAGFRGCSGLTDVNLEYVYWYGESAFENCVSLNGTITIREGVDWIRENAFYGCTGITNVELPSTLKRIDSYAFAKCYNLQAISIPDKVSIIENAAFLDCWSLASINIPNGVTSIRSNTFVACRNLKSVTIPESVTEIGLYAFHASGLESITIPSNVKTIIEKAFLDCQSLTSVTIEDGVTFIGECNFMHTPISEIVLPNSVEQIDGGIFEGCENLKTVVLSENITKIPGSAFKDCSSLINISIPVAVTTIDNSAFQNCTSLAEITLPKNVAEIGELAFAECSNLAEVTSLNVTPYSFDKSSTFSGIPENVKVYVLKEVIDDYKDHSCWNLFKENITALATKNVVYSGNSIGEESTGGLDEAALLVNESTGKNKFVFSTAVMTDISDLATNVVALNANYGDCVANSIVLTDAQPIYCPEDVHTESLSYLKNFGVDFWQPLYVPFESTVGEWNDQDAEIAYFNNVHQYDDGNGVIVKTTIESFKMKRDDVVKANVPYFIKPSQKGIKEFKFTNKILTATPKKDGTITCSSTTMDYAFVGNYQPLSNLTNCYVLITTGSFAPQAKNDILSPFRMRIEFSNISLGTRAGGLVYSPIYISVDGEIQNEINYISNESQGQMFDLNGKQIKTSPTGIYIKNGKLIINK